MPKESSIIRLQPHRIRLRYPHSSEEAEQQEHACGYEEVLPEIPDLTQNRLNDCGNAQRLIAIFGSDIRYSPEIRSWYTWDGRRVAKRYRWRYAALSQGGYEGSFFGRQATQAIKKYCALRCKA